MARPRVRSVGSSFGLPSTKVETEGERSGLAAGLHFQKCAGPWSCTPEVRGPVGCTSAARGPAPLRLLSLLTLSVSLALGLGLDAPRRLASSSVPRGGLALLRPQLRMPLAAAACVIRLNGA